MERAKNLLLESLRKKGFSEEILSAFNQVKREDFVPEHLKLYSYDPVALPIESGSTISQPQTIAFMISLLKPKQHHKILEIGSGSGYVLSLISKLVKSADIYGLEINSSLVKKSRSLLSSDQNLHIIHRSGFQGLPEKAPFDRILISASLESKATIYSLINNQLADPGILVCPIQSSIWEFIKEDGEVKEKEHPGFSFVPLRKVE